MIQEVMMSGFELKLYSQHELAFAFWYTLGPVKVQREIIEELGECMDERSHGCCFSLSLKRMKLKQFKSFWISSISRKIPWCVVAVVECLCAGNTNRLYHWIETLTYLQRSAYTNKLEHNFQVIDCESTLNGVSNGSLGTSTKHWEVTTLPSLITMGFSFGKMVYCQRWELSVK